MADANQPTSTTDVAVRLNQQQLELLDRTVTKLGSPGRADVLQRALRDYHAAHRAAAQPQSGDMPQ